MNAYRAIHLTDQVLGVGVDLVEKLRDSVLSRLGAQIERGLAVADERWPRAARWRRDALSGAVRPLARVSVGPDEVHVTTPDGACVLLMKRHASWWWSVHRSAYRTTTHYSRREALADLRNAMDEMGLQVSGWEDVQ